jgi:hypothetical protein
MNGPNDGGPAFPVPEIRAGEIGVKPAEDGMSLRDYFAAKAMAGLIASGFQTKIAERITYGDRPAVMLALAELSGEVADAMLAERAKAARA